MTGPTFRTAALGVLLFAAGRLGAAVLKVPADHPTITAAVNRATDGDTVLVEDGVYLESNIEITKRILVKSKNRYGAVIYGSARTQDAVFIIRAAARLEGFILKNAAAGIKQRRSPDVEWEVSNVVIYNCSTGISVDDPSGNTGSARIRNVAVFGRPESVGIATNDAGRIEVADCLIANCEIAFEGYDHLSFRVTGGAVFDCSQVVREATAHRPIPPATSRIEIVGGLRVLRADSMRGPGRIEESLGYLRTAVFGGQDGEAGGGGAKMPGRASMIALAEAGIMLRLGEQGSARGRYMRALETARKAGMDELAWLATMGLARTAGSGGKTAEALGRFREAVDLLEKWIPAVPMGLRRIDFLEDKAPAFMAVIGLYLDEQASDPAGGHAEQAFLYAERLKSLTRFFPPDARGRGPAAAAASKAISSLQLRLQDADLGAEAKEDLIRGLEMAEEDYQAALIDEERAWTTRKYEPTAPAQNGERLPSPLGFRGVKDRLAGRAVLSYVLGEKESFAFLATETGLSWARLPGESRIAGMVEPYLRFLQLRDGKEFRGARAGRLLFDLLVGPFAERLREGPRGIIVVPEGRLTYLPFEALVAGGGDGIRPAFWGESAEISYALSATRAVGGRPWNSDGSRAGGSAPDILAVGNSDGIRCDNRSRRLKRFFLPLAHVGREIRSLAGYFQARKVTTLIDAEASEAGLRSAGLSQYGILHLAAHGVIDDTDWWRSALLLRPDPGRGDDGFFTALEISELELGAALVVLSGCGTGAGSLHKGEGIRGLSGAFLRAGAEHLVVSLWSVDDRATAELMGRFYRGIAAGASPAQALAAAKKQMIGAGYLDPFFWAPFVLIRDGKDPGKGGAGAWPVDPPTR